MAPSRTLLRVAFETEDFPLGLQPIIECIALLVATLGVELAGSTRDADSEIVAEGSHAVVLVTAYSPGPLAMSRTCPS